MAQIFNSQAGLGIWLGLVLGMWAAWSWIHFSRR